MSKKNHYTWQVGEPPPKLKQHSVAKHEVLRTYLDRYIDTLTVNPVSDRLKIHLIDGFCGGGEYQLESDLSKTVSGSPHIFMDAVNEGEARVQAWRKKPFHIDASYYFVDINKQNIDYLRKSLDERNAYEAKNKQIHVINDRFENALGPIIENIKSPRSRNPRALFLLDQYGFSDIPFQLIRKILGEIPAAEVILTFSVDTLINYASKSDILGPTLDRLGLGAINKARSEDSTSNHKEWKTIIEHELHKSIISQTGARFFTPFFITADVSNRSYWLIHLSMHVRARDVMTEVHWSLSNHFKHYGAPGMNMLGFDAKIASPEQFQQYIFELDEFKFDHAAKGLTIQALSEELPTLLHADRPRQFIHLLSTIANQTPASGKVIKEAINQLHGTGNVEVFSNTGAHRKYTDKFILNDSDWISLSKQIRLF